MSQSTDTTFFTNEPGFTLLDRFVHSLPKWTQFFDVLVWYFRSSGFLNLYQSLGEVEKIRILVGLNLDRRSYDLIQLGKQSSYETKSFYSEEIQKELETSEDHKEVEEGITKFIEYIHSWKLEIRVYPNAPIHAKVYIMRKNQETHEDFGKVITGSSNFSQNGLVDQLEFNVELKEARDVQYALGKFEELWKESIDVSQDYIDTIKTKTWMNEDIVPYQLYLKFLYEYFDQTINEDKNTFNYRLPERFKELQYQKDAVRDAMLKLQKHNGVFLADVVWLGKTFISSLLAQQINARILVICPPHLMDYWKETFDDFRIPGFDIESLGKLDHIIKKWHEKYQYVIIDEAHRFRNEETWGYESLRAICQNKKIILVSATPFNNSFKDLLSLITLFQEPRNSTLPNIKNIKLFIEKLDNELKAINKKEDYQEYRETLKRNSNIIRERVLKHLMIRRTRQEIKDYYPEDMTHFSFPEVRDPKKIMYQFDAIQNELFENTIAAIKKMTYARYTPSLYMYPNSIKQVEIIWQLNLKWFMKTLMVKRLESSFYAFRKTLKRMLDSYTKFIEMYDKGDVYVSKKVDIYDLYDDDEKIDELLSLVDKGDVIQYKKTELRTDDEKNFERDLKSDYALLKALSTQWGVITTEAEEDPKLQKLLFLLKKDPILHGKKLILFSESKETVEYLEKELSHHFPWKVYGFSSDVKHGDKDIIRQNFDPKHKEFRNDIQILLTTDVLAEGVNLHSSNIIINYDIPWNPTRVLQRIGRINRIGTKHTDIHIYNFFPTDQSNNEIQLEENVKSKMAAFISLLWSDAKQLTDDEEVEVHTLFDKINSAKFLNGEEEDWSSTSEIKYLKFIRHIRDSEPDLFEAIKKLPKKSRSAKKWTIELSPHLLTFFRKKDFLRMYLGNSNNDVKELDFGQTVQLMECESSRPKEKIHVDTYYTLLTQNKNAYDASLHEDEENDSAVQWGRSNEKDLIKTMNFLLSQQWSIDQEELLFKNMLIALQSNKIPKKVMKDLKKTLDATIFSGVLNPTKAYNVIRERVDPVFLLQRNIQQEEVKTEIILNMYII